METKEFQNFLIIWWKLIDGTFATIGRMLSVGFAYKWDEMANVWGEWIEDSVVMEEKTKFGDKATTVSAALGYIEHKGIFIFPRGQKISKILNVVFGENSTLLAPG